MNHPTRRIFGSAFLALFSLAAAPLAAAAVAGSYPCQTLTLVSPYPPGGTTDILARMLVPGLGAELGLDVIVENRAGASSNIGTEFVSRAAPDGCTALLGNNTGVVINRNLYPLRMDPVKSLAPVGPVASVPLLLYVNAKVPASSIGELIELLRKAPDKYAFASGGSGAPQHLAGELIKLDKQVDMLHVPYRGQGPALNAVLGGEVPIAFETTTAIAPQLASGRIRVLATTADKRITGMPDVPTMTESGFENFVFENWYGLFVPAETPAPVIAQLNAALNKTLRSAEVQGKLKVMGSSDVSSTPQAYSAFIAKEVPYWQSLVKRSDAKVD